MKKIIVIFYLLSIAFYGDAQYKMQLSSNASIGISTNIETYFFVEKLAVEHIDNYVFDIKGTSYAHQPIVHYGFQHFQRFKDEPVIIRSAEILKIIRDTYYDNGPVMDYLLNQKEFPLKGRRVNVPVAPTDSIKNKLAPLYAELTDSLRSFYTKAKVADFIKANEYFYKGALAEVVKDIDRAAFANMEKWFGKQFSAYELYISPAMPITPGEDSYRGYGPQIISDRGNVPSMVISSSRMLPEQEKLSKYKAFGFNNAGVTSFIAVHEMMHSFVNPVTANYAPQIKSDSSLYTDQLRELLQPLGITNWEISVNEHLVRLAEIRLAVATKTEKEAARLRQLHIGEYHCILIPLLEEKIVEYETNRNKYPDFKTYLPVLISYLHSLSPQIVNEQIAKYKNYTQDLPH